MFVCLRACECKTEGVTWVAWAACETKGMKRWWCLCQGHNDKACFFKAGGDRPLAELCLQGILCVCVCVCACVRQSSDTRGVNGNPGSLPLFMVDGSQFSVRRRRRGKRRGGGKKKKEQRRSAKMKWRLSDVAAARRP